MPDVLALPPDEPDIRPLEPVLREFARAPLVPVAIAVTAGLIVDRYGAIPPVFGWLVGLVALVTWWTAHVRRAASARVWLWIAAGALAATHHSTHRHVFGSNDIAAFAPDVPAPARVRGNLAEEPIRSGPPRPNPLVTEPRTETTTAVLVVTGIEAREGWVAATGRMRVTIEGQLHDVHAGDLIEITGRLSKPQSPGNPGERDFRSFLLDDRITAVMRVEKSAATITRLEEGWRTSLFGWLGVVRGWGTRVFRESLPEGQSGLASALLLGDTAALDREEWDAYVRTGVVHVLAISGQHLVILAAFVWVVLRILGVRRRHGAWAIIVVMIFFQN